MPAPIPGDGALLVLPSRRVRTAIIPWRQVYDPAHWRIIPPHITVAYPFSVREDDWSTARPALIERVAAFKPFMVTLAELGTFEAPQKVLWLRPDDGGMLNRIHAALVEAFPAWISDDALGYVPHLTLGFFGSLLALAEARAEIAAAWQPLRFRVKALSYAVLEADGVWRSRAEVPLGGC
jgi:2'-5' RNA ligase